MQAAGDAAASRLGSVSDGAEVARRARLVFAAALGAVDAFLGDSIADGLQHASLADLAADQVVDAVLRLVNGLDARDFGFVEGVCVG